MTIYDLDKLMSETRKLAGEYRKTTGQTLPVTADLANYDAIRLLELETPEEKIAGIDAIKDGKKYQIKGRVLFGDEKKGQRVGQINLGGQWDAVLLVLFNGMYQPTVILEASREVLEPVVNLKSNPRGALTVGRFQSLSTQLWQPESNSDSNE